MEAVVELLERYELTSVKTSGGYRTNAVRDRWKGDVLSLRVLRAMYANRRTVEIGPRGGRRVVDPVTEWLRHPDRQDDL